MLEGNLTPKLSALRALSKGELEELLLKEEMYWRQKARVKWIREGKYFHKVVNGRRNRKFIKSLVLGVFLDNIRNILEEIMHFFGKLYSKPPSGSWGIERLDWSLISIESATWLDRPYSKEEKALRLNGFTISDYECQDVIKDNLQRAFLEFHNNEVIN